MREKKVKKSICYENYPFWIIFVSNLFSIVIYATGAYIIYQLGLIWMILYLAFILFLKFNLMRCSCVNCYYYRKYCAIGFGKLSSIFFKKGNKNFSKQNVTWKDILPDFLVSLIPILIGIILLIIKFNILILIAVILLLVLTFFGNAIIHGSLVCKYCKQRKLGCPADNLFNKKKK
jgi:hypothetical protein